MGGGSLGPATAVASSLSYIWKDSKVQPIQFLRNCVSLLLTHLFIQRLRGYETRRENNLEVNKRA